MQRLSGSSIRQIPFILQTHRTGLSDGAASASIRPQFSVKQRGVEPASTEVQTGRTGENWLRLEGQLAAGYDRAVAGLSSGLEDFMLGDTVALPAIKVGTPITRAVWRRACRNAASRRGRDTVPRVRT